MKANKIGDSGLVYATEHGRMCRQCGKPAARCACRAVPQTVSTTQRAVVRVGRETKGRKGKGVTVISGVPLSGAAIDKLGSRLKRLCGSGGTVKDGVIEIQGDHRDRLIEELMKNGWTVKRSGG
ncbi:MAG: translation initiation factor Sui1 [Deltaproteobacteria bacterium]|nr:translation initiation factor Sui1 [Deltaproteobacteria bacterium]